MKKITLKELSEMVISVDEWESNYPFTFEINNEFYKVTIADISEDIDTESLFNLSPCIINDGKIQFIWNELLENEFIISYLTQLCGENEIILHDEYENHLVPHQQDEIVENIEQLSNTALKMIQNFN